MIDRFVKGYFFVSGEQAEEWLRANQINDRKKIHEVMECSSVYQPRDGIHVSQNNKGLVYLWVGRFDDNKDPVTLVSAFIQFARSRNVILHVIYQQNDLYEKVDAIAKGCEQIILVGKQNKEQLQQWYNNADFIVSTSHYEGSGIAVCEALSCGCIPILSSIPSFRWMAGSTGLFFQAGNENDLLTAFHKSENIDIAEARKKVIENFQTRLSFMAIASTMEKAMIS
ncbi:hypothetical protein WSM22_18820 [Cytophagales bacterium WSM2-2]|nr:hypothetical protein WSM22_18820 [Cytophagales bacterium WSM2-2]